MQQTLNGEPRIHWVQNTAIQLNYKGSEPAATFTPQQMCCLNPCYSFYLLAHAHLMLMYTAETCE